ncbi:MAG: TIGR03790 family protein, partial [Planctomycetes bacterium]|nr:TIGR03790 family protein [Planctomycetota bacterium]
RGVPSGNIIPVSLGTQLRDSIGRGDYEKRLAGPIRRTFATRDDLGHIECLVTTYGVPFKVGRRDPLSGFDAQLKQLRQSLQEQNDAVAQLEKDGQANTPAWQERRARAMQIQMDIDRIEGKETDASVDSELAMVLSGPYELHRWQPNLWPTPGPHPFKTLMVCRLDGPSYNIAKGLIDKALAAEAKGLKGSACFDSRGLKGDGIYSYYDQSLRDLARLTQLWTGMTVREEQTEALFEPGSCPQTALYCGWYSLQKYVDAFDFVDGAVGYHIASFEAAALRDPKSLQWCPAMLQDGITATLGPVNEPYLFAFPEPSAFFGALYDGRCLVEAYFLTERFTSWQMVLIGDPLYKPFKAKPAVPQPQAKTDSP